MVTNLYTWPRSFQLLRLLHDQPQNAKQILDRQIPWRLLVLALLPLALCYGLLWNPYWVPGGDSEVYTAIARSFARDQGFLFNGQHVAIAPPGWPYLLSLLMRISPEFGFLKASNALMMLGSFGISFFVLRRFVPDTAAAIIVVIAGLLHPLYPMTFWLHTEAAFCLIASASLLFAVRISEGKSEGLAGVLSVVALLMLLAMGCFVRWTGLIQIVLVAAILLSPARGKISPRLYVITALAIAVTIAAFLQTRSITRLTSEQAAETREAGGGAEIADAETQAPSVLTIISSVESRSLPQEYAMRFLAAGRWFGWFLWYPTRFGRSVAPIDSVGVVMGWVTIGLLAITLIATVRKRQFLFLGLGIYTSALVMNWPNPNARYFVPVAPFILAGVWHALSLLTRTRAAAHVLVVLLPLSVALVCIDLFWLPARQAFTALGIAWPTSEMRPMRILTFAVIVFWSGYAIVHFVRSRFSLDTDPPRILGVLFFGSILAVNLPLLAIDIRIMRSGEAFYSRWEASSVRDLIRASHWLYLTKNDRQGRVGISETYFNLGRSSTSKFGLRAAHLLSDCVVFPAPRRFSRTTEVTINPGLNRWAREKRVDYYLFQEAWQPWRLWHFRLPFLLQQRLDPLFESERTSGGWKLFVRRGERLQPALIPTDSSPALISKPWPRRVPGL